MDKNAQTPKYPLELVLCPQCSLVQLRHTVPAEEMYRQYWYRSGTNRSMTEELQGIACVASEYLKRAHERIALDIGCNDGTLLRAYPHGVFTVGFEPAKNLVPFARQDVNLVINDFFNAAAWRECMGPTKADVVTSIAMFYDLDDPNTFVHDVSGVLSEDGLWIIQMADLWSMLSRNMWDNICHEHLEYYSLLSLENLLCRHGLRVEDVERNDVNGGSIRFFVRHERTCFAESRSVTVMRFEERESGLGTAAPYADFSRRVTESRKKISGFVRGVVERGKSVYVYGASTKGNTLLQACGLDNSVIKAAAERNPDKWGKFTVGTNIPIISEEEARACEPDYFLVLPWHFLSEFVERESAFLAGGGSFIVPLPEAREVTKDAEFDI